MTDQSESSITYNHATIKINLSTIIPFKSLGSVRFIIITIKRKLHFYLARIQLIKRDRKDTYNVIKHCSFEHRRIIKES